MVSIPLLGCTPSKWCDSFHFKPFSRIEGIGGQGNKVGSCKLLVPMSTSIQQYHFNRSLLKEGLRCSLCKWGPQQPHLPQGSVCLSVCTLKGSHSWRHLRLRCPSSAGRPPTPPSGAAPGRPRRSSRGPASPCWGASSCSRSTQTQSWGPHTHTNIKVKYRGKRHKTAVYIWS